MVGHLLLLRGHRTCRSGSIRVVCIAWRATEPVLSLIHGKTGGRGGAARRGMDGEAVGGGGRREGGSARLMLLCGSAGPVRSALRTKAAKTFET